jgi:hypothetical protein
MFPSQLVSQPPQGNALSARTLFDSMILASFQPRLLPIGASVPIETQMVLKEVDSYINE